MVSRRGGGSSSNTNWASYRRYKNPPARPRGPHRSLSRYHHLPREVAPLGRPRPVSGQPVSTCDHCLAGTSRTDVHLPVTLVLYVVGRPLTAESSGSVAGGGLGSGPSSDVASCPLLRPSALCLGSGPVDSPISMHRYEPMVSTPPALRGPSSPWRRVMASRCA